MSKIFEVGCA
jgi:thymidylate synthase ThyX